MGSADCGCVLCTSGLFMTGPQKKQLLFACRIPVGLTVAYSLLIDKAEMGEKKSPNIPGDL